MRGGSRLLGLALAVVVAARAGAQTTTTTAPAAPAQVDQGLGFETPRATVRGFLAAADAGDWARAAEHLDLRGQPAGAGPKLARELDVVLQRTIWLDPGALSPAAEGDETDGLREGRDLVGTIQGHRGTVRVFVDRVAAPDGTPEWKFSRSIVQQVPALWNEFGKVPFAGWLPKPSFEVRFLGVQLWQWGGLLVVGVLAWAIAWLVTAVVVLLAGPLVHRTRARFAAALLDLLASPARLALAVALASAAVAFLRLPVAAAHVVGGLLAGGTTVAVTWVVLRGVDALGRLAELRFADQAAAVSLVPLGRRSVKAVVVVLAVLVAFQKVGFNVTGVIAGLGIGGLAVALAAQKTLENLFGGLSIIADAPVRIGDFCKFGDNTGTVEDIGLRSVRLRTPERTIITVPNGVFAGLQIENYAARDRLLLTTKIALKPDVPLARLRALAGELRGVLLRHPDVDPDPARVRLVNVTASALELEVFAYVRTGDVDRFYAVREELLLAVVEQLGPLRAGAPQPPS
jgi:MscS family membrane protein